MSNYTYKEIDQIEENLSIPYVKQSYPYNEILVRLLCQALRQNRYLADQIGKSCTESRMAFNIVSKLESKIEKINSNVNFLLGNNAQFENDRIKGLKIE